MIRWWQSRSKQGTLASLLSATIHFCQTWHDVTPAVPSRWYCQCLSPCCLEESVIGNSLYTLARYARRWGGGDVAQAEPGTPARGHLADGRCVYYKYQLATQVDRGQAHHSQKSDRCFGEKLGRGYRRNLRHPRQP